MAPVTRGASDHDAIGPTPLGGPTPPGASGPQTTDSSSPGRRYGIRAYAPGGGGHRFGPPLHSLLTRRPTAATQLAHIKVQSLDKGGIERWTCTSGSTARSYPWDCSSEPTQHLARACLALGGSVMDNVSSHAAACTLHILELGVNHWFGGGFTVQPCRTYSVHFGVQGVVTRSLMWQAEPRWIFLGCLIPDIPWILPNASGVRLSPASTCTTCGSTPLYRPPWLLVCSCAAPCSNSRARASEVFNVLALNACLHLLLDACETKWANGVHLFCPSPGSY